MEKAMGDRWEKKRNVVLFVGSSSSSSGPSSLKLAAEGTRSIRRRFAVAMAMTTQLPVCVCMRKCKCSTLVRLRGDWRAVNGHVNISNDQTFSRKRD